MNYDIYLVPNGRQRDFDRGITANCPCYGCGLSLDDLRSTYRDLADENFRRECYDRIWNAAEGEALNWSLGERVARAVAEAAADTALREYLDDLMREPNPLDWGRIEWHNDLKFMTIRESEVA